MPCPTKLTPTELAAVRRFASAVCRLEDAGKSEIESYSIAAHSLPQERKIVSRLLHSGHIKELRDFLEEVAA